MSPEIVNWIWLGAGAALLLSELALPGAVVGFLGAAAMAVAGLRWLGVIESHGASFGTWLAISAVSVLAFRSLFVRWSKPEREVAISDEDVDAFGKTALVVTPVTQSGGRIRFQGTTWPARCLRGTLPEGEDVRIVDREGLEWIVEPVTPTTPPSERARERS